MKKVVRILGLCAIVALAFTSCKKDNQPAEISFKATINQPVNTSKTHIDNATNMLVWDANNTIKVFNANGVEGDFTTNDSEVVEATFVGTLPETSTYTAFYPNAAVNENAVTLNLSGAQNYVANNFGNDVYPMAANSTLSNDVYHFQFHSPASVLRLRLKSNNNCTVKSITMTGATGDKLAGDIVYSSFSDPTSCTFENTTNSVTLTAAEGVQLLADEETAFNLVVMSGAMSVGTQFVVKDMSNNVIATLTTTHANTLTAEHILVMPILAIDYELPNVITNAATSVTYQTATINGEYTFPAGAPVNACGFYWSSNRSDVENLVASTKVNCSTVATPMSYNLSGLTASTTYYFRAWGANSTGEVQGAVLSFTTGAAPTPVVTTNAATNVTNPADASSTGSATLNGVYNANGTTITEVGFYWGTTNNPTTKVTVASSTATPFAYNLTGLQPGTYYFKAYAKTSTTTTEYYGNVLSFTINQPAIPGAFSTSPTRMVVFAHANLQYNVNPNASQTSTTTPMWRFAEHQWDYLGENTNITNSWNRLAYYWKSVFDDLGTYSYQDLSDMYNTSHNYLALYASDYQNAPADFESANYWIDLFSWGATGYDPQTEPWNFRRDHYINGTGVYFKKGYYNTAMTTFVWGSSYGQAAHPGSMSGPSYSQSWYLPNIPNNTNWKDYDNNYDWGYFCDIYNPASGEIDPAGTWRTLTGSYHGDSHPEEGEWYYLMHCRTTANGQASVVNGQQDARWCKAIVNGVRGIILFPDVYVHPSGVAGPNNINRRGDISCDDAGNNYSVADWTAMEAAGAEFLPCAGTRFGWGIKEWVYDPLFGINTDTHSSLLSRAYADNKEGYYWSSTSRWADNAGDLRFLSDPANMSAEEPDIVGNVDGGNNYIRSLGCAVRLAKTVRE